MWSALEIVVFLKFAHKIEDGDVEDVVTLFDCCVPKRLGEMAFPDTGRADEEDVASFFDVVSGG